MDFTTLVQKRHSTRAFTDQVIPRSQLDQVIQDALTTPSWVNSQPWRVYVATGKTLALIKEKHREAVNQGDLGQPEYPVLSRDKWDKRSQANMPLGRPNLSSVSNLVKLIFVKVKLISSMPKHSSISRYQKTYPFGQSMISVLLPKH